MTVEMKTTTTISKRPFLVCEILTKSLAMASRDGSRPQKRKCHAHFLYRPPGTVFHDFVSWVDSSDEPTKQQLVYRLEYLFGIFFYQSPDQCWLPVQAGPLGPGECT